MDYKFTLTTPLESKFLSPINSLLGENNYLFHHVDLNEIGRREMNGAFTLTTEINNQRFGIIYNDFKVNGGGFGHENSNRICAFIDWLNKESLPLVFVINSMGVKITEGRAVFPHAFKIVPSLKSFLENNLLVTIASGSCLGLGALIFAAGDYKISIKDESKINLTGPEVFKLFFGEQTDFMQYSSGERMFNKTQIVDEVCENKDIAYQKTVSILTKSIRTKSPLVRNYCDFDFELFPNMHESIRTYLAYKDDKLFGLFVNPPGRPNMLNVNSIKRFIKAIKIFKKLQLPVLSIVDTPGADPRIEENDKNIIGELFSMSMEIIEYPYPKKAIIVGRCYGGASVISFPQIFGGEKSLVIKKANLGIMSNNIISQLLSKSGRLLEEWQNSVKNEASNFSDLLELNVIDKIIEENEIPQMISQFIERSYKTIFDNHRIYLFGTLSPEEEGINKENLIS